MLTLQEAPDIELLGRLIINGEAIFSDKSSDIILMDGDLEDPPELIPKFLEKWEEGNEVVYGVKESRQRKVHEKLMFSLYYKLLKRFSEVSVDQQAGMFSLMDKKVANALKKCSEKNKYYHCPAFAVKIVDKIGAGDAMLALLSCSIKTGFDADLALFMGSLAAAQSVETIGNSAPVSKVQLLKTFYHAIK